MLSPKENDPLFNRRLIAFGSTIFTFLWYTAVLIIDVAFGINIEKLIAYLGVPAALSGLGLFGYLGAAAKQDKEKSDAKKLT